MMKSVANNIEQYLNELPDDKRKAISIVRQTILKNILDGYDEVLNWGMITYEVSLETYPNSSNDKPLMYAGLASKKSYVSLFDRLLYVT